MKEPEKEEQQLTPQARSLSCAAATNHTSLRNGASISPTLRAMVSW